MKKFQIKVYEKDWTFKQNIKETKVRNTIQFSNNVNWGQWRLNLELNVNFANTDILQWDFIKVNLFDDNFPNWKLIYTWIVEDINRVYQPTENLLTLSCVGLEAILTRLYYNSSWYTFTKNDTASNIVKDIISYFNSKYPWNWINDWWVENTVWNVNIEFDYDNCSQSLQKITALTDKKFFIEADWTVNWISKPLTRTHALKAEENIQSILIEEDSSNIINSVFVIYDWWVVTSNDWTSQSYFWLFEQSLSRLDIKDSSTAQDLADETISLNKNSKQKITIEVNTKYILENIQVLDTVKVMNIDYSIENLQIQKISYTTDIATLYLDEFDSIEKVLINN